MSSTKQKIINNVSLKNFQDDGSCNAEYQGNELKVFGGLPSEIVNVEVLREYDNKLICFVIKVIKAHSSRVEPQCKYFLSCTGCQLQHISYDKQLDLKKEIVLKTLKGVSGFSDQLMEEVQSSPQTYNYRNHGRFTVAKSHKFRGNFGFINRWTKKLIEIEECKIMNNKINRILLSLKGYMSGHSQFSVRVGINSDDYLIQPKINSDSEKFESGQQHYFELINGVEHRISSPSFFQVNTYQAERLGQIIKNNLNLNGSEVLIDAFSGVGTFSILLSKYVKKIYGIESSYSSIQDAQHNSRSFNNIEFVQSEVEFLSKEMFDKVDVVILDPSRKGVDSKVINWILGLKPRDLVYVSCEIKSLRRDLDKLTNEYEIRKVIPVDMFPHTKHLECLVILKAK